VLENEFAVASVVPIELPPWGLRKLGNPASSTPQSSPSRYADLAFRLDNASTALGVFSRPVESGPGEQLHTAVVDPHRHPITVELYLVHPLWARGRLLDRLRNLERDECRNWHVAARPTGFDGRLGRTLDDTRHARTNSDELSHPNAITMQSVHTPKRARGTLRETNLTAALAANIRRPVMGSIARKVISIGAIEMQKYLIAILVVVSQVYGLGTGRASPFECRNFSEIASDALQRPQKPSCVDSILDEVTLDSCREEMSAYKSKISDCLMCLSAESREALSQYNAAVSQFNCKAEGSC
jgi:hypothetical protein